MLNELGIKIQSGICEIDGIKANDYDFTKVSESEIFALDLSVEQAQKDAILKEILLALNWLKDNGNDLQDVMIVGHYHFSDDRNKNGAIESWERIKECPSFDAYQEYKHLLENQIINPNYSKLKLPKNR
jgi:hypothetical protein